MRTLETAVWQTRSTSTEEIKNGMYDFAAHAYTQEQKSSRCFSSIVRAARCLKCVSDFFLFCAVAVHP